MDPDKAKWTSFRMSAIGMAVTWVTITIVVPGFSPLETGGFFNGFIMLGMMSITVLHVWTQVRIPKHASYDFFALLARMTYVFTAAIMTCMSIGSVLVSYKGGPIAHIGMHGLTLSSIAAVGAVYLNMCRKPPPRRTEERSALTGPVKA
jgi:hypothetical protein